MATMKKNIPTLSDLKCSFHYISDKDHNGMLSKHNGRLIPNEFYYAKSTQFIDLFMQECSLHFAKEENGIRYILHRGKYHQEAKLVWYYHRGQYPQTAVISRNGDQKDTRINNLVLTTVARRNIDPDTPVGIVQVKSPDSYNAWMWSATYSKNKYEERPVDKDGHICYKDGWKTRGWHKRKTKIVNTRSRKLVGYYMTKEKAIKALRLYTNEVEYPICRYRTDMKLKQVFLTLNGMFPNNPEGAVWHYIQVLYNRKAIDADEAADLAEAMGHGHKVLPLRDDE